MGAWGPDHFDNDKAMDFLADFETSNDPSIIRAALQAVVDHGPNKSLADGSTDWLTTRMCEKALAAAEIVAGWIGRPSPTLPSDAVKLVLRHMTYCELDMISLAREAIRIINIDSELNGLWKDTGADGWNRWNKCVKNLEDRLAKGPV
jgi:hypothetical protein